MTRGDEREESSDVTPAVSVVCATYRRPDALGRLLGALAAQDLDEPFEVIVSDDGSGDLARTRALVETSPLDVRLLEHATNRGPGAARNDGWRSARAPYLAFTDDDCQPTPGWLRAGLERVRQGGVIVVGKVDPDPAQQDKVGPWSRSLTIRDARFMQTANTFYARADLEAVGGFDEVFRNGGEDTDLGMRVLAQLGRQRVFEPDAYVLHDVHPGTARSLARSSATRWTDLPLVLRRHPEMRAATHHGVFWKRTHPATLLALGGLVATPLSPLTALLVAPWVVDRAWRNPVPGSRLRSLPGTFLVDSAEVVGCVRGSVRHRSLLL
ncbi:MAG: glycosyl transferase family 2 [Frankiales bacterium]|nr:glycosyl transferase family 2 [Frankiales bacterium]